MRKLALPFVLACLCSFPATAASWDTAGWMGQLLARKPLVTLGQMTMPGSHDAGAIKGTLHHCPVYVFKSWAATQGESILDQLKAGTRFFDLRLSRDSEGNFETYHSCDATPLATVLNDVKTFISNAGSGSEAVILKFSHTHSTADTADYRAAIIAQVKAKFGSTLFSFRTSNSLGKVKLSDVKGKVIAVFDSEFGNRRVAADGIIPYVDVPDPPNEIESIVLPNITLPAAIVYDHYSKTTNLDDMVNDQFGKLGLLSGGPNSNGTCPYDGPHKGAGRGGYGNSYLFLLSWTLTGGFGKLDIEDLAAKANPSMTVAIDNIRKCKLRRPNIVYYDFVDETYNKAIIAINDMP